MSDFVLKVCHDKKENLCACFNKLYLVKLNWLFILDCACVCVPNLYYIIRFEIFSFIVLKLVLPCVVNVEINQF